MEAEGRARGRSKPSLPKPRCTCASFHHVASVSGRPRSGSNPRTNRTPFLNLPSLPSNEEGRTPSRPFRWDALTGKVGEAVRDTREPNPRDLQSSEGNVSEPPSDRRMDEKTWCVSFHETRMHPCVPFITHDAVAIRAIESSAPHGSGMHLSVPCRRVCGSKSPLRDHRSILIGCANAGKSRKA